MNVRKAIKKIAAVSAVSGLMVGTTLMGAFAASTQADLSQLPGPFVKDGVADFQVVLGASAAPADLIGAIDISNSLQASAVTEETVQVPGSATEYSVDQGVRIGISGDQLNFKEALHLDSSFRITDSHLPELLADGELEDDDGATYDYTQEIVFNSPTASTPYVNFGIPSSSNDVDMPQLFVEFGSADNAWELAVDFSSNANFSALQDSETLKVWDRVFTFDPNNEEGESDFSLFGSDTVEFLQLNQPKTIVVDGQTYEVEVVGGNSESTPATVVLSVNGQRETMSEGQSKKVGGVDVFVQDLFVTNIPTLDASATIFVGSNEYQIKTQTTPARVELNDENLKGMYAFMGGTVTPIESGASNLTFQFRPRDLNDKENRYLLAGETVTDPMFGIEMSFAGVTPALNDDERAHVGLERTGDTYVLSFTNREGTFYQMEVLEQVSGDSIRYVQDGAGNLGYLVLNPFERIPTGEANPGLTEDDFFFTYEGSATNPISKVFYVDDFEEDDNVDYVTFVDAGTGREERLKAGDNLGATGLQVDFIDDIRRVVRFATNTTIVNYFVTEGDMKVYMGPAFQGGLPNSHVPRVADIVDNGVSGRISAAGVTFEKLMYQNATGNSSNVITWVFDEDFNGRFNQEGEVSALNWTITFRGDGNDDDIEIGSHSLTSPAIVSNGKGEYDDFEYSLTPYGTYVVRETDQDGDTYDLWYPPAGEASYAIFLSPTGSSVSAGGSSGGELVTQMVNPVAVGAAVLDTDVSLATARKNLIVVGGPCVNSVAAELMGNPEDCLADFPANTALVELFDLDGGKVAMLVAGAQATETQAASRAVATMDSRLTGDAAVLSVTSVSEYSISAKQ